MHTPYPTTPPPPPLSYPRSLTAAERHRSSERAVLFGAKSSAPQKRKAVWEESAEVDRNLELSHGSGGGMKVGTYMKRVMLSKHISLLFRCQLLPFSLRGRFERRRYGLCVLGGGRNRAVLSLFFFFFFLVPGIKVTKKKDVRCEGLLFLFSTLHVFELRELLRFLALFFVFTCLVQRYQKKCQL